MENLEDKLAEAIKQFKPSRSSIPHHELTGCSIPCGIVELADGRKAQVKLTITTNQDDWIK